MASTAPDSTTRKHTQTRKRGEGSVTLRKDGRWMARFTVTLPSGERKRQHIVLKDKEEVIRRMHEEMTSAAKGVPVNHDGCTVAGWLEHWMKEIHPKKVKDSTLEQHRYHVDTKIVPEIGTILLKRLAPSHVQRMIDNWEKRGVGRRQQQLARNVLSSALTDAMKLEYVHRNAARLVDPPKYQKSERRTWTAAEVRHFLNAIREHRLYGLFLILFQYGLRRGEACGLRWQDIDFEENVIRVRQQLYSVGGTYKIGELKTPQSRRDLALTLELKKVLMEEYERRGRPFGHELLYLSVRGNHLDGRSLLQFFQKAAWEADLKPITLHEIRHTVATLLKNNGVTPKEAQAILGHASIITTLEIYTHVSDSEKRDAIYKLSSRLLSPLGA